MQRADDRSAQRTPGHSPGHQSLLVTDQDGRRQLIAGQCCYTCDEFDGGTVATDNLHDETYRATAADSIAKLRSLGVDATHFSHDRTIWKSPSAHGQTLPRKN